jgi:amidase
MVLERSAAEMSQMIRNREISSEELVAAHLKRIRLINPVINAAVELLADSALRQAKEADKALAKGEAVGPLHGVPFSIKDSLEVAGTRCTAGTMGRKHAPVADRDATLVARLRTAGAIAIAKTNLPDLLFSFETDNLIYGRTNNPYDLSRTPGGSSGGESALIAACGSPLGLGSDAFGSVRLPAAFCGIASIKPTSGRLPRTGHVPPPGGWLEAVWQIGPMARYTEDLILAMHLLAGEDGQDFTTPPVELIEPADLRDRRVAFFTYNGFARCTPEIESAVRRCAEFLAHEGIHVEERRPPGVEQAYELEFALFGADAGDGIDEYLRDAGSTSVHVLHRSFVARMRPYRASGYELAKRWAQWDEYRSNLARFFAEYDAILCPVYTQLALKHRDSLDDENFRGFSYTMAWNLAGAPAATVRCGEFDGLPVNVQVVTKPWRDLLALQICRLIEAEFGGWRPANLQAEPVRRGAG